jgi:hypothetical protein
MPDTIHAITLFEACEKLNRSKKTLSRYIRKGLLHPKEVKSKQGTLEYRFSQADIDTFKERENERRQDRQDTGDGTEETTYTPLPEQEADLPLREIKTEETRQDTPDGTGQTGHNKEAEAEKEEKPLSKTQIDETGHGRQDKTGRDGAGQDAVIELLKETTGILKEQLEKKDKQIEALNDRQRETNIILNSLQSRLVLLEKPKEKKAKPDNGEETGESEEKKGGKGFFKRLFNSE